MPVSFRVTADFKRCLEEVSKREQRSQTNMLEWLLAEYCKAHNINAFAPTEGARTPRGARP